VPLPAPVIWGAVWGVIQAGVTARLLVGWRPRLSTRLGLTLIAAVYIGFQRGRWTLEGHRRREQHRRILRGRFAAVSVSGSAWLIVFGLAGHGLKDLWQHRTQFVRKHALVATVLRHGRLGSPPEILTTAILMGVPFHG